MSPIASKHSLIEVSASKVPAIRPEKNFTIKRLGGCYIETVLAAKPGLSDVSLSATDLASFTRSAKPIACAATDSFPFSGGAEIEQANKKQASEGARLG